MVNKLSQDWRFAVIDGLPLRWNHTRGLKNKGENQTSCVSPLPEDNI